MDQQQPATDIATRMPYLTDTPLERIGDDECTAATDRGTEKTGARLRAAFFQSAV